MQQREEKQLESALDSIIQRVNDLKQSIASMIFKIENEYESITWPTFLDNYALISGQVGKNLTDKKYLNSKDFECLSSELITVYWNMLPSLFLVSIIFIQH